ncbi:hypothetical protein KM043_007259 [Ampulex compressa]|nr:hypothetical protein KM043_007259 [Ampulex compressa]
MQATGDYYQRAPRCCPGRNGTGTEALRIGASVRGAELLCCCCSCSTATSTKTPGLLASLGVCVLVLGYTLLGAFAFMALEGGLKSEPPTEIVSSGSTKHEGGGSYILSSLEDDSAAMELRARTVERLWSITEDLNVLYKENWTRLAAREVLEFQENLARGLRRTSSPYEPVPPPPPRSRDHQADRRVHGRQWTFSGSLLYSLTLITTIGYSSVAPRTVWGRLITIVYALAGIPLMLVYLSTVGDVLARSFRRLYGRLCRPRNCTRKQQPPPPPPPVGGIMSKAYRYDNHVDAKSGNYYSASRESSCDDLGTRGTSSAILLDCGSEGLLHATTSSTAALQDVSSGNGKRHFHPCSLSLSSSSSPAYMVESGAVRIPISLCLVIMLVYICGGAVMFNRLEGWSLLEGVYFCFTSLGTIGFGDLMPVGSNAPSATLEELSLCACSLYILAGMGLIAMCFNLVQEEVVRVVRVFGRTCGMSSGVVVGPIGGTGTGGSAKGELDDGGGTSDSRLGPADGKLLAPATNTAVKLSPAHHSLPRKKPPLEARNSGSLGSQQFQRGHSLRRSCLSPTQYHHQQHHHHHRQQESALHFEYFVPRSVSEFNLAAAAVTDMAVPPPPPPSSSALRPPSAVTPPIAAGTAAPSTTALAQPRLLDNTGTATRSREKMVTFEDEGGNCSSSTPTRKNLTGIDNVFM